MTRRLDFLMLLVVALAAHGCADDDGPPNPDGGEDGGPEDSGMDSTIPDEDAGPDDCTGGDTHYFLVNSLGLPFTDNDGDANTLEIEDMAPGFNLDKTQEAICETVDVTWRGEPGVDNALVRLPGIGPIVGGVVADALEPEMLAGNVLLIVRLDNVDSLANDSCVNMSLLLGLIPEGEELADAGGPEPYLDDDGDGVLDANLTLDINNQSFVAEGDPLISAEGTISGGRISATSDELRLNLGDLDLTLRNGRVDFSVQNGELVDGVLGGSVPNRELAFAVAFAAGGGQAPDCGTLNNMESDIEGVADIDSCNQASVGFNFAGVPMTAGENRGDFTDPGGGGFDDPCDVPDGGTDGGTDAGMDSGM